MTIKKMCRKCMTACEDRLWWLSRAAQVIITHQMDDRSVYAEGTHVYPVAITLKVTVGGFLSGVCISQRGHVNSNAITTVPAGFSASFIFLFLLWLHSLWSPSSFTAVSALITNMCFQSSCKDLKLFSLQRNMRLCLQPTWQTGNTCVMLLWNPGLL